MGLNYSILSISGTWEKVCSREVPELPDRESRRSDILQRLRAAFTK